MQKCSGTERPSSRERNQTSYNANCLIDCSSVELLSKTRSTPLPGLFLCRAAAPTTDLSIRQVNSCACGNAALRAISPLRLCFSDLNFVAPSTPLDLHS